MPSYIKDIDLTMEIASVMQYVEYGLVLGFLYPSILPLATLAILKNLILCHHATFIQQFPICREVGFGSAYLWICMAWGITWLIWLYYTNDWEGKWMVVFGTPASMVVGMLLGAFHVSRIKSAHSSESNVKVDSTS